jgi:hypothetical protein
MSPSQGTGGLAVAAVPVQQARLSPIGTGAARSIELEFGIAGVSSGAALYFIRWARTAVRELKRVTMHMAFFSQR